MNSVPQLRNDAFLRIKSTLALELLVHESSKLALSLTQRRLENSKSGWQGYSSGANNVPRSNNDFQRS
jgi:hypothetical protein